MTEEIVKYELTPEVITVDFPAMQEKLDALLANFQGLTPDNVEMLDTKTAKAWRSSLNKMAKELNDARIAIKRDIDKPYDEFKAGVDNLIAQINAPRDLLDECIKAREALDKEKRRKKLEETYEVFAGVLAEHVPFERVLEPKWLNKTHGEVRAENDLEEKVAKIAKGRNVLLNAQLKVPAETMAEFYRTLDLSAAMAYDDERAKELDKIAAMEAEIAATKAAQQAPQDDEQEQPDENELSDAEDERPAAHTVPLSPDEQTYEFSISVPYTRFKTTINEAQALKNHIRGLLHIEPRMTKSPRPVQEVA